MAARLCAEPATEAALARRSSEFPSIAPPPDAAGIGSYERTDREFHHLIIEYSRNRLIREMDERFGYIVRAAQMGLVRPPSETLAEHLAIISAIARRDPPAAHEAMTAHHLRTRAVLLRRCDDAPGQSR